MKVRGYDKGKTVAIEVMEVSPGKYLQVDAARAFIRMRDAAVKSSITLKLNSGWRNFAQQERLYDEWHAKGEKGPRPARPGYSRHHMGLAADIGRSHDDPDGAGPLQGPTDKWLQAHAGEYGFTATVTGEPWHWEYKG